MTSNYKGKKKVRELTPKVSDELLYASSPNTITEMDLSQNTSDDLVYEKQIKKEMQRYKLEREMICVWGENRDPHVSTHVTGCNNLVTKILLGSLTNRRPHH
ncbi:11088_t:CDS:1, partial [Acaulospora morrowiae]